MFFDRLKTLIFRQPSPGKEAGPPLPGSADTVKDLNDKPAKGTEAKLNYEKVITAYQLIIPSYSGVSMFSYYRAGQQLVTTTRDIGNHMRFQLFHPVFQADEIDPGLPVIKPLAELIVTVNYDLVRFDSLNMNERYSEGNYGVELLTLAFSQLRMKKSKLISGSIKMPEGEKKQMNEFFRLQNIPALVRGDELVIVESPFNS